MDRFDALVIGAGEAGARVAALALGAGKRVALVYRAPWGSTCLNTGCVPSKFFIHRARVAHVARTARRFHVDTAPPVVRLDAIAREKDALIESSRDRSLEAAHEESLLTLLEGAARFTGPQRVIVSGRELTAERIFIATGLGPEIPDIPGLDRERALTSATLLELAAVPRHLIVIGGGYIACELGQTFRRFGSRVTIIQRADHLLSGEEPDVSRLLEDAFRAEGIELVLGHEAERVEHGSRGVRVVARERNGSQRTVAGSHLLVAAGRRPNTGSLDLDAAGVRVDEAGYIAVDSGLATTAPGVWAVGDVNGEQPFTRVCTEEARIAFANAFAGAGATVDRRALGHAVFTDPEIGSVGLTEHAARAGGADVAVGLVTFDQVERARLMGETTGLIKYVVERGSRRLLGCHVIGPHGAELVYDAVMVMRRGGVLDEIAEAIGIFPTLQEGMEGTARSIVEKLTSRQPVSP